MQRVCRVPPPPGVWTSFPTQPIDVAELRPGVAESIARHGEHSQLLVRLGDGPPVPSEPRRAVEHVLST